MLQSVSRPSTSVRGGVTSDRHRDTEPAPPTQYREVGHELQLQHADAESPVGIDGTHISGREHDVMFTRNRSDQRVVHTAASDPQRCEFTRETRRRRGAKKAIRNKGTRQEFGDNSGRTAQWCWQSCEYRIGLERGMPCNAEDLAVQRGRDRHVIFMVGDNQRDRDARIDE